LCPRFCQGTSQRMREPDGSNRAAAAPCWRSTRPRLARRAIDALLAPGGRRWAAAVLRATLPAAGPILDVGCGPLAVLGRADLVGVDRAAAAVRAFSRDAPAAVADARALPFADGTFAASLSVGLLHHLDDAGVRLALAEMERVVRPGGTLLVLDGVAPERPTRAPVAALIRALDRGRLRPAAELEALLAAAGPWTVRRQRYAWTGLEGLVAVRIIGR
jgi:SAM-dependent methyltransferase